LEEELKQKKYFEQRLQELFFQEGVKASLTVNSTQAFQEKIKNFEKEIISLRRKR